MLIREGKNCLGEREELAVLAGVSCMIALEEVVQLCIC